MHAAEKGHATCVELLAEREGGMQESDGKTAFMSAARNGLQKQRTSSQRGRGTRRLLVDEWILHGTAALGVAKKTGRTAIASILSG